MVDSVANPNLRFLVNILQTLSLAFALALFGSITTSCSKSKGSPECKKACSHVQSISKDADKEFDMGGCIDFCDKNKGMVPCIMKAKTVQEVNGCG